MTRVFWDTMLFIYLLEGNATYFKHVERLLKRSYERGDVLYTSCLAVGELMAGAQGVTATADTARDVITRMGFQFLDFNASCMTTFSNLRSKHKIKAPDAIHLSCAGAVGMDLFLTNDEKLFQKRLTVPGIHFISDIQSAPL